MAGPWFTVDMTKMRHSENTAKMVYSHRVDGLSVPEIARQTGLAPSTIRNLIRRESRRRMRDEQ